MKVPLVFPRKCKSFYTTPQIKQNYFHTSQKKMTVCYSTIKITAKKLPQITFCKASSSESDSSHLKSLSPLDHEGADTRMILHCSKQRLKNVIIYTVDSDVVVISVHFFDALSLDTLWIRFGVGKRVKFIAIHEISNSLTPDFSKGLTLFHAWTGADTISAFDRHG